MIGCRIAGYLVVRSFTSKPDVEPLNSPHPDDNSAGHGSRSSSLDKLARSAGRAVFLTHNMDAKLAEIAATTAMIVRSLLRSPGGSVWKYLSVLRTHRHVDGKYFLPNPCLQAVAAIGWACIAVPSVRAALNSGAGG